ncbi:MAG: BON domain-containing protein [Pseudomonadota bacterium]
MRLKLKFLTTALSLTLLGASMQSCIFVAGAAVGAAAAGAVVFDKRTAKESADDKAITEKIEDRLNDNAEIESSGHIVVATFNGVVLLAGDVPTQTLQEQVSTIAKTVPGIVKLYNQVVVSGKPSTLSRMNDSYITAKIKTQMVATDSLESSEIQVVTVAGTVFLMGVVSQEQASIATDIAQHVSGVVKVVRVFQYN